MANEFDSHYAHHTCNIVPDQSQLNKYTSIKEVWDAVNVYR